MAEMAVPPEFSLRLDERTRRLGEGKTLLGGSPLRLLKLSEAGSNLVDGWEAGQPIGEGKNASRLARRLLDTGMAHPRVSGRGPTAVDVTVVIPIRGRALELRRMLESLAALDPAPGRTIVVDDGSANPFALAEVADDFGVELYRRRVAGGPSAARNTGLRMVDSDLVVFIDSDVEPTDGWLDSLLPHFNDPAVTAVAPRVVSRPGPTVRDRYEEAKSPLDLGPDEAAVAARTRVSYVPSATLVARASAIRDLGGFDEDLRYGEDVDLIWRATVEGSTIRYVPTAEVLHDPREDWVGWAFQRLRYGTAAAALHRRHPGALPPVAVSGWSAAAWALAATGVPLAGLGIAGASAALLPRKLSALPNNRRESLRLAALGHLHAGEALAGAITRAWWPLVVPLIVASSRARRTALAAAVVPAALEWRRDRPDVDLPRYVLIRLIDDLSYGAGLWTGCRREGTIGPLLPDLSSWPGRKSATAASDLPKAPTT